MNAHDVFECYGIVTKEEPLSCVDNDLLLNDTCVLEAISPYFGYYNDIPNATPPHIIYFVLDSFYPIETILRATSRVQGKIKTPIDALAGHVTLFNQTCRVIRLLNLTNYGQIAKLQEKYMEEGLGFKKRKKKFRNEMAIIRLKRNFPLIPQGEGVYLEQDEPNFGYFELTDQISWEDFKKLTTKVKYYTELLTFDAALAFIYRNQGITDLVRIYRENLSVDRLKAIQAKYHKLLS